VDGPCPRDGALGYCNQNISGGTIRFGQYHYNEDTQSLAEQVCMASGGSWYEL
jgi:hypothetical protein